MSTKVIRSLFLFSALMAPAAIMQARGMDAEDVLPPQTAQVDVDAKIWSKIHHANEVEIRLANMAIDRTSRQDVREYASQLVRDHVEADKLVSDLAILKNFQLMPFIPVTDTEREEAQEEERIEKSLTEATGIDFDRQFLTHAFNCHEKNIKWLKVVRAGFQHSQSDQLAADLLPVLKSHREMARDLLRKLDDESVTDSDMSEVPNVMMIKIPAKEGVAPSVEAWQEDTPVEIVTLSLKELPVDEAGNIHGEALATACIGAVQTASIKLNAEGDYHNQVPGEVQKLFGGLGEEPAGSRFANYDRWYSYNSFRPNYGFYGYGYRPHYGYYGAQRYNPSYGVYYNGRTFNFSVGGSPYWNRGYYYYPYYRR